MTVGRNAGGAKLFRQRPAPRQRRDVHVETVARQPARRATAVCFRPSPVERRNDVEDSGQVVLYNTTGRHSRCRCGHNESAAILGCRHGPPLDALAGPTA